MSMSKGSRFAGRPISRNRSGHFRLIHRRSFRGGLGGSSEGLSDNMLLVMRKSDVEPSMNIRNSSGETILIVGDVEGSEGLFGVTGIRVGGLRGWSM
jgi:hypothetical protein